MTLGVNDYPYAGRCDNGTDPWGFTMGECTSFVAWRVNHDLGLQFNGSRYPAFCCGKGNGGYWARDAVQSGIPVDGTPARGSAVCLPPGCAGAGSAGHIAFVLAVNGDGSIQVEDYNWFDPPYCQYHQHSIPHQGCLQFIHFETLAGWTPAPQPAPDPGPPNPPPPVIESAGAGVAALLLLGAGAGLAGYWARHHGYRLRQRANARDGFGASIIAVDRPTSTVPSVVRPAGPSPHSAFTG